ncbi:MAG: NUDIX hydrolase [Proteobacteria bacterium]|nr:NUDIX hydrolase [Pseudomonadota bacterium]
MKWPREYPPRPIVAVGIVIWRQEQVLLVRRNRPPRMGAWSLPGGAQKVGESVFEAAEREVMEETSLTIRVLGLVDVVDSIRRDNEDRVQYHYTLVDVVAEWLSGIPNAQTDVSDAAWFDVASISALGMWSETNRIIEESARIRQAFSESC